MNKRLFSQAVMVGVLLLAAVAFLAAWSGFLSTKSSGYASNADFLAVLSTDQAAVDQGLANIESNWDISSAVMLVEVARQAPTWIATDKAIKLLTKKTDQPFGYDYNGWYTWIWTQEYDLHPNYAQFKADLYSTIDPRFVEYFDDARKTTIRLDEILWGTVLRDSIPPLRNPQMVSPDEAEYLDDSNVVFGIEINGDARAYPKRILAWHELVTDTIGGNQQTGVPCALVYCTMCGSMIAYQSQLDGVQHEFGTSGFLYRSSKLMYDRDTKSLWSTLTGEPVVGPLVGKGIKLKHRPVVTTTWGQWRTQHPQSTVLSLDTGYDRDYGEGVAYSEYFATDVIKYGVPTIDTRLKNKDEVLALRFDDAPGEQLAISAEFLKRTPVYHDQIGDHRFVVITDATGANRVYETVGTMFASIAASNEIVDSDGEQWTLSEEELTGSCGQSLERLPASRRAFWFGWYSTYPQTRLVK